MARNPDRHPDDINAQQHLIRQLTRTRTAGGYTQPHIGAHLGVGFKAVSNLDRQRATTINIATLCGYARAINHQVVFSALGLPDPAGHETPYTANLLAMAQHAPPPEADALLLARFVARVAAARRWLNLDATQVAARMGIASNTINKFETDPRMPLLSTLQRYVRAVGGILAANLQPVPAELEAAA